MHFLCLYIPLLIPCDAIICQTFVFDSQSYLKKAKLWILFSQQLNRSQGTMSVYQSNISKNKIDLKQAQYKDIDKRYFDQLIQLKVGDSSNFLMVIIITVPFCYLAWKFMADNRDGKQGPGQILQCTWQVSY